MKKILAGVAVLGAVGAATIAGAAAPASAATILANCSGNHICTTKMFHINVRTTVQVRYVVEGNGDANWSIARDAMGVVCGEQFKAPRGTTASCALDPGNYAASPETSDNAKVEIAIVQM